jgi:hypothetical protein
LFPAWTIDEKKFASSPVSENEASVTDR